MATTKVNSEFIAVNAISGTIIADGAITSTHLAANCVDSSELVTGSIDTIHIAANQVTATKIVTNAIQTRHIADDQVTGDKLTNNITIAGVLTATSISVGDSHTIGNDGFDNLELTSSTSENIVLKPAGSVYLYNAGAAKLVTTSTGIDVTGTVLAENLTLNAGTPGPHLSFENVGGSTRIKETNSASFYYQAYNHTFEGHTGIDRLHISQIGDISFYEDTGSTAKLFWDASAESLGIGTTSPSQKLDVNGTVELNNLTVGGAQGSDGQLLTSTGSGVAWEDAPAGGPTFKTFGTASLMIGSSSTGTINAADYNTAVSTTSFAALTTGDFNVAFGEQSLDALTTGGGNTALGVSTLGALTTANNNTAVGISALTSNTDGTVNTAVGSDAMAANTTGSYNVAVGSLALDANTTGGENTAIGYTALSSNTTGGWNTGLGRASLGGNTTGQHNVAVGHASLGGNTSNNVAVGNYALTSTNTGGNNTAVGYTALRYNTSGQQNTAMGGDALQATTTGSYMVAVGYRALKGNTTGYDNIAVGSYCMDNATVTGYANTAVGQGAARVITSGFYNSCVGAASGDSITTSSRNTCAGYGAGADITTSSNNTVIGANASISSPTDQGNQVVLGQGLTGVGYHQGILGGVNAVYNQGNSTAWQTTSDIRIKKNIEDYTLGLDVINGIRIRTFDYRRLDEIPNGTDGKILNPNELPEGQKVGVIAQEIIEVLPSCVKEHPNSRLSVTTDNVLWTLVKAVQELSARVEELEG